MSIKACVLAAMTGLLFGVSTQGVAHHGQVGLFDESRLVELRGVVKEWSFVNPHPVLLVEVMDASGQHADWDVYFGPSAVGPLRRRGFSAETFKVGETVIVKGHPATITGSRGIDVWGADTNVTRADGGAVP